MFKRQICYTQVTDVLQFTFIAKILPWTSKQLSNWQAKIACFSSEL